MHRHVAVEFGLLGVTCFGLALTPVFYVVLRGLVEGRRPATAAPIPAEPEPNSP